MRAISTFSLEAGTSTFWWRARIALRMRVSMSATGSVKFIVCFSSAARLLRPDLRCTEEPATTLPPGLGYPNLVTPDSGAPPLRVLCTRVGDSLPTPYHDDLATPGISPRNARPRKHRRQMPNLRR